MIKIITHDDLDGIACYLILDHYYKGETEVVFTQPGQVESHVHDGFSGLLYGKYNRVYVTDLSISSDFAESFNKLLEEFSDTKPKFKIIDHHKSAEYLNNYSFAEVVPMIDGRPTSGAYLVYMHLYKDNNPLSMPVSRPISDLMYYADMYDSWKWTEDKIETPNMFNSYYKMMGRTAFIYYIKQLILEDQKMNQIFGDSILRLMYLDSEEKSNRYINKSIDSIQQYNMCTGHKMAIIIAEKYANEIATKLFSRPNNDISVLVLIDPHNKVVQLRGNGDVDLSVMALKYGGGGHSKSAGFPLSPKMIEELVDSAKISVLNKFLIEN